VFEKRVLRRIYRRGMTWKEFGENYIIKRFIT
jgi:hypothetical protein